MKSQKKRINFKTMKLASKTATIIGSLLFTMFVLFIGITLILTRGALIDAIDSEFNNMSEKNAVKIQGPFDSASASAADLQRYIQKMYDWYLSTPANDPKKIEKMRSAVYDIDIERFAKEIEDYMVNTIMSVVATNDDIRGAGVFFEPGVFDDAVQDYTLYITVDDVNSENIQSYGAYENYKDAIFYKIAKDTQKPYFTPPYEDQGIQMISATYPIVYDGKVKGVISVDINATNFDKIVNKDSSYPTMSQDVLTSEGFIVFDSTDTAGEYIGMNISDWMKGDSEAKMQESFKKGVAFEMVDKNAQGKTMQRYFYPIKAENDIWWSLTSLEKSDKEESIIQTTIWLILLAAFSLFFISSAIVSTLRRMINPIEKVVEAAKSIASGDFNVELTVTSEDEIGILTGAFDETATTLKTVIKDISYVLNEMAKGNLDVQLSADYVGDLKEIEVSIIRIIGNLNDVMLQIKGSSQQVSGGSAQIANGAQSLAEGATDQAGSIEELQATVTDITAQVERNAQSAKEANEVAQVAGNQLQSGNVQMKKMLEAMDKISSSSNEIKNVIKTIEDIAEQTNLLSLNASIEAARAGEAGRGFAVVADQVGKLASESSEATKITSSLIEASISAVKNGILIADETALTIDQSVGKVQMVVENAEKISLASNSQAVALDQLSQGIEQVSCVIEENSAMAEESASASEELSAQAQILDGLVSRFVLKE